VKPGVVVPRPCFKLGLLKMERLSRIRREDGEPSIWRRYFRKRVIRNNADSTACMAYVYFSPIKNRQSAVAVVMPSLTFKSCVQPALYPVGWIGSDAQDVPAAELIG
jgi:hypothetical protein